MVLPNYALLLQIVSCCYYCLYYCVLCSTFVLWVRMKLYSGLLTPCFFFFCSFSDVMCFVSSVCMGFIAWNKWMNENNGVSKRQPPQIDRHLCPRDACTRHIKKASFKVHRPSINNGKVAQLTRTSPAATCNFLSWQRAKYCHELYCMWVAGRSEMTAPFFVQSWYSCRPTVGQ